MKLPISQLPEGDSSFHFESPKDSWVQDLIRDIAKRGYQVVGPMKLDLKLTKLEPDYYLRGVVQFSVTQVCARCAESFPLPVQQPFHVAMAHVAHDRHHKAEVAEESDELDVNYFEGPDINLAPVIEEQFFLSLPYQSLCRPNCRGVCQQCGKNLNLEDCGCKAMEAPHPFSKLKEFRLD